MFNITLQLVLMHEVNADDVFIWLIYDIDAMTKFLSFND